MNKITRFSVLLFLILLIGGLILISCDEQPPNTPTDSSEVTEPEAAVDSESEADTETDTEAPLHEHSFGEWNTVKEASCSEGGSRERVCSCGEKEIQTTAPVAHELGADGYCSICDHPIAGSDGVFYFLSQDGTYAEVIDYVGDSARVVIAETYEGAPVTKIANNAFEGKAITSVIIPNSVTSIEREAFKGCSRLASVTIPNSVTSIGDDAFAWCDSLTSVTIPDSVTSIGDYAFRGCTGLTSVTIPDSVTSIGNSAFYGCPITMATIPAIAISSIPKDSLQAVVITSGESIGDYAFAWCDSLTSVTIGEGVTSIGYRAFYNCYRLVEVINKSSLNITAGSSVAYYAIEVHYGESKIDNLDGYLFYTYDGVNYLLGYTGTDTELILPDRYNGGEYEIYRYAFYYCKRLTSVTIGEGVTSIGDDAFSGCVKLVEVINKSSLNITAGSRDYGYVGYYAIEVHNGESKIDNLDGYLFYTYDGVNYLFGYTGTDTGLILPDRYNGEDYRINQYAFTYCDSLTSVTIPDSMTSIGNYAFHNCYRLTSVTIGNSVTSIGEYAFYSCSSLTSVTIPDGVTGIGDYAFAYCSSLTSVTIPDSMTSIGDDAFAWCDSLTSVTIPDSVTSIGSDAFYGCPITTATIPTIAISSIPKNSLQTVVITGGESIGLMAFLNCTSLTSVTIPDGVTGIGDYAFAYCRSLTSVTIPDSVTSIGNRAFDDCDSLTSVVIPDSVTSIGDYAFFRCSNLTNVMIPDSVTSIGNGAFYGCTGLTSVTIPDSVTSIGDSAFSGCTGLTSVTISDSVTSIGSCAFYWCRSLTSVTIGNGVTSIGDWAFYWCDSLTRVYYAGSASDWNGISIGSDNFDLTSATRYYYSEVETAGGWRYVDGVPTPW